MPGRLLLSIVAFLCALPAAAQTPESFLIIIADDLGVERVEAYRPYVSPTPPPADTPNIDALAAQGLLFTNAWAHPLCSPTRAALLTGELAFRTGTGMNVLKVHSGASSLDVAGHTTIPQMLATLQPAIQYERRALGKWHLAGYVSGLPDQTHPVDAGFQSYRGSLFNFHASYGGYEDATGEVWEPYTGSGGWQKLEVAEGVAPATTTTQTYATHDTAEDTIAAIGTAAEPWLLWVAFNAPHIPYHVPPSNLSAGLDPDPEDGSAPTPLSGPDDVTYSLNTTFADPTSPTSPEMHRAMAEAMDVEIGRILAAVDQAVATGALTGSVTVFFLGDNGTPAEAVDGGFPSNHAKSTLYELGVRVPFIVRSPHLAAGRVGASEDALVSVTDVFETIRELAGVDPADLPADAGRDSISLVEFFDDGNHPGERGAVYTEVFTPNGKDRARKNYRRAIRDVRYKLLRRTGLYTELYDLAVDPQETHNLLCDLPSLNASEWNAFNALRASLEALIDSTPYCAPGATDLDLDGLCDLDDNCTVAANPTQLDADGPDGWGNACDADYDNSGSAAGIDFSALRSAFGACDPGLGAALCPPEQAQDWDPRVDHDGNQWIGGMDLNVFRRLLGTPGVGPSGVADDADGDGIHDAPPACP